MKFAKARRRASTATLSPALATLDCSRREKLRETFMQTDVMVVPAEGSTLDVDRLERCLARLAERERMVVLLTFYAERSAGEVGRELGATEGNVRVIRHRAVERLRTCMTSSEVAR